MSRSRRKPIVTCGYGGIWKKLAKRYANKKVRRSNDVINGMNYKRLYCSWEICDYKFYLSKRDKDGKLNDWYNKAQRK